MRIRVKAVSVKAVSFLFLVAFLANGCTKKESVTTLKDAYKNDFLIGVAMTGNMIKGLEPKATQIIKEQFNSIVSENALKWDSVHPEPNKYTFDQGDSLVAFGERNNMKVIGHCLLWHNQTPKWVFEDAKGKPASRDTLLKRMQDHITTVVSHYKGKIYGWDVLNEAIDENGELRKSKWLEIIGEDYIQKAFEFAHAADTGAQLYYNDYNIELSRKYAPRLLKLISDLKSKGIKIDAVGIQAHWHLDAPKLEEIDSAITAFSNLGVKVMFTEMDINVLPRPENLSGANITDHFQLTKESNPYPETLPDSMQQVLAKRYVDIFKVFLKHKGEVTRVTFWGLYDGQSWLNNWPIAGRTNYPLLYDRNFMPKPAFNALIEAAKEKE
jgi:endo-1,4-beta-xylanase